LEELIVSGESGIIARTPEQWRDGLERLIRDAEERRRVGAGARLVVDREIWADVLYPRWKDVVFGSKTAS